MFKRIYILLLLLLLTGCTSIPAPGEQFSLTPSIYPQSARVFFYRPKKFIMSAVELNIFVDGNLELALSNGTYSVLHLDPGEYEFSAREKKQAFGEYSAVLHGVEFKFRFTLISGNDYFVGWYPSNAPFTKDNPEFFVVSHKVNPDSFHGALLDIQGDFGIVSKDFALQEISKTRQSNSLIEPDRI